MARFKLSIFTSAKFLVLISVDTFKAFFQKLDNPWSLLWVIIGDLGDMLDYAEIGDRLGARVNYFCNGSSLQKIAALNEERPPYTIFVNCASSSTTTKHIKA